MADLGEYYILKCPYCDKDITRVMECPDDTVICPNCRKELALYTVFGYNMWLVEQGKVQKVKERPIKDVSIDRHNIEMDEEEFEYEDGGFEFEEELIAEDYLRSSMLMQKRPQAIHELLSFNADVCTMQYRYLIKMGFTRSEAIEIIKKLIEQNFIL